MEEGTVVSYEDPNEIYKGYKIGTGVITNKGKYIRICVRSSQRDIFKYLETKDVNITGTYVKGPYRNKTI